jgi:hypothetical protein
MPLTLTRRDIIRGLERMGQLARERGIGIELSMVGGAVQALVLKSRKSTKDVDCVPIEPEARIVRQLAAIVASERDWPSDWLNDGPVGFVTKRDQLKYGRVVFKKPGIVVRIPKVEQLLAMKLMAWRDPTDMADAARLLKETVRENTVWRSRWFSKPSPIKIWEKVEPYLIPNLGLKATYAFAELWGDVYGDIENDNS